MSSKHKFVRVRSDGVDLRYNKMENVEHVRAWLVTTRFAGSVAGLLQMPLMSLDDMEEVA